jgi:alkanesulfonate monooxygenase SsuD/methylene tetrahydromethanopterin reductase-like flavin-dependent oxidoreductase (luciferase family)
MGNLAMRYGAVLPGGTAHEQLELAELAESAGWDGVFVWEAPYGVDAWSLLAAAAVRTSRVRLGTMLTPLPWRRPAKLASQVATVDQLSDGRAILGIGVGAPPTLLPGSDEVTDLRTRAALLDSGVTMMRDLWEGRLADRIGAAAAARPVQERLPVWVVGVWPRPKSLRRALRCDGIIAQYQGEDHGPGDARALRDWLTGHGAPAGFDLIADGETQPGEAVTPWVEAGCTWWLETRWGGPDDLPVRLAAIRDRLAAGPPPAESVGP